MRFLFLLFFFSIAEAQWPTLTPQPYSRFKYFGFESPNEANGNVVIYGPLYKTSLALVGDSVYNDSANVHNGDSSIFAFITGAHNPDSNCNIPGDSLCQRHRAYVDICFWCQVFFDTTGRLQGAPMPSPTWVQFWFRSKDLHLHHHPTGEDDWFSPSTYCGDPTDACFEPITTLMDSLGYFSWAHVPVFDSANHIYQAGPSNDPYGIKRAKSNQWNLVQAYLDNRDSTGYASLWVNGYLVSTAHVRGKNGLLSNFHAGLYASSAVGSGKIWNDDLLIAHVDNLNDAILLYMANILR